jgi:hypothetical protein
MFCQFAMSKQVYCQRSTGSKTQVYHKRTHQEREDAAEQNMAEREVHALDALQQLGDGIMMSSVMVLPIPTAASSLGMPIMSNVMFWINGLHVRQGTN